MRVRAVGGVAADRTFQAGARHGRAPFFISRHRFENLMQPQDGLDAKQPGP
jgi:hypothetical protein